MAPMQFRQEFTNFLVEVGVKKETSLAYNPSSNGLAERAVQAFKKALKKSGGKGDIQKIAADLNSFERTDVPATPGEMMARRATRSCLPLTRRRSVDMAIVRKKRIDAQDRQFRQMNRGKSSLDKFRVGDRVRVQDPVAKTWAEKGVISEVITHENAAQPS